IDGKIVSFKYYGAGHIMGTCRMGDDPKQSVVDKFQRSHDHNNLYLVGSSTFPTGSTANPTLTLAALSLQTAQHILDTYFRRSARRCLLAGLDRQAPAFALICDRVIAQTD